MGGSSGGAQTVTNKTEVDPVTNAWRTQIMNAGNALYQQGHPNYYPGSTVVPFADQTQAGLSMLESNALGGVPNMDAANAAAYRAMSGFNPAAAGAASFGAGTNPFVTGVQQAGQGVGAQAQGMITPGYAQQLAQTGQQGTTAGVGALEAQTQGGVNPALQGLWNQGSDQIANRVNANFMTAGRSGPNAAHTGTMTRELGNLWNQIYMPAYENQQNRSMQAGSALAGIQQNDRAAAMQGLSAAGGLNLEQAGLWGSLANADASRNLQAQTTAGQMGLEGLNLQGGLWNQGNMDATRAMTQMPSLWQLGQQPAQQLMGVGGAYEGLAGEYLNDSMTRYNYPYTASWNHLNQYSNLMSGLPFTQSSSGTQPGPQQNRGLTALGGATSGASVGSNFGPWGTAIGAIGGGLLGLFA